MKKPLAPGQTHAKSSAEKRRSDARRFKYSLIGKATADLLTVAEGPEKGKVPKKHRGTLKDLWPTLIKHNQDGNAVFMMVNQSDGKGTKDENVIKVKAFFLDYDGDDWGHISLSDLLLKFKLRPHIVVKTSPGRYHVYWKVSDCALDQFKRIQQALAANFGSDPKVANLARVMRVPGTYNHKNPNEPFLTELAYCDESHPGYSANEFVSGLELTLGNVPNAVNPHTEVAVIDTLVSGAGVKPSIDLVLEWLSKISPEDRDIWIKVCMALKSWGEENGLKLFLPWSSRSIKYDEAEAMRQWNSVKAEGGITWETLRYLAYQGAGSAIVNWSRGPENMFDFVEILVQDLCQHLKYATQEKQWYAYNSGIWLNQPANAEGMVRKYLHEFVRNNPRHPLCTKLASSAGLTEVMRLASTDARCHISSDTFDARVDTVAVEIPGGLGSAKFAAVELSTGQIRAAVPGDYFSRKMGVPYILGATCPKFLAFLEQIADGDAELIETLHIAFGYAMFGHVQDQVMFILIGDGSNGKGVLLNTIAYIFGGYATNVSYSLLKRHNTNPNAPTPALAPLAGARFVPSSEFGEGDKLEEALVKNITGSDPISYRPNYGQQATFKPQCKVFLSTNYFPRISFAHEAMWRRLFAIRFTKRFSGDKCNSQLEDQLKAEGSGILNWLIEGAVKYHRLGKLLWPASTIKYLGTLKSDADTVGTWLKNNCRSLEGGVVPAAEAYASYKQFAKNNNQSPIGVKDFKQVLIKKGYDAKRRSAANVFIGFVINE